MIVRLLTSLAGLDFAHASGDLFACDAATAARLIAAGAAEAYQEPEPERAIDTTARERAVKPMGKRRA